MLVEDELRAMRFEIAVPLQVRRDCPARPPGAASASRRWRRRCRASGSWSRRAGARYSPPAPDSGSSSRGCRQRAISIVATLPNSVTQCLFQNPCVLAAAALRRVDHERAFFEGHAGEAAGHDVDLVAEENVGPQIDVARLEPVADQAGRAREIERGLGDVVARIGLDLRVRIPRAAGPWSAGRSACRSRRFRRPP